MFLPDPGVIGGIVAVTGHRPDKIGGHTPRNPQRLWIKDRLSEFLIALQPRQAVTGMALGVDQDFAEICIQLGIPFTAAVPHLGQEVLWPEESQNKYRGLLGQAAQIVIVSPGGYAAWKLQKRNEYMVDHCTYLIAVWDGSEGGTLNCIKYAKKLGRKIYDLDPRNWDRRQ